jgi:glycosyltransferase involved in cell wall biosynthesis
MHTRLNIAAHSPKANLGGQKICLCMITKDEENIITKCLESVAPYISFWVINDNGSTDKTPEVITEFFKKKGIPGILDRTPWKGFNYNRSVAFKIAEKESGCDWMFVIDSDDHLITPLKVPLNPPNADSFIINIQEGPNVMQTRQQLFRVGCEWLYSAIIHEYPASRKFKHAKVAKTTEITVRASRGGARSQDPLKYWRDAILMEKDLERVRKIPKHKLPHWEQGLESRYLYYICQSWHDFGHFTNAIKWANKRVLQNGFKEEIWRAHLLKVRCLRRLDASPKEISDALNEAIKNDTSRAETYFELVSEYVKMEDWKNAWRVVQQTAKLKRPKDKLFIVEDYTYKFGAKKEAAWIAYKLGLWEESYKRANELTEDLTQQTEHRVWAYNVKHKNVVPLIEQYKEYSKKAIKNLKGKNRVVFNLNYTSFENSKECLTTFLNSCVDYANIDQWYCSEDDVELVKLFPFLQHGRGEGDLTINVDDNYLFFHKCTLVQDLNDLTITEESEHRKQYEWTLSQLISAKKKKNKKQTLKYQKLLDKMEKPTNNAPAPPKIVYLNRNGSDELYENTLPDLFQRGKGNLASVEKVVNCPYAVFKNGDGMWSFDRISCLKRSTYEKEKKES